MQRRNPSDSGETNLNEDTYQVGVYAKRNKIIQTLAFMFYLLHRNTVKLRQLEVDGMNAETLAELQMQCMLAVEYSHMIPPTRKQIKDAVKNAFFFTPTIKELYACPLDTHPVNLELETRQITDWLRADIFPALMSLSNTEPNDNITQDAVKSIILNAGNYCTEAVRAEVSHGPLKQWMEACHRLGRTLLENTPDDETTAQIEGLLSLTGQIHQHRGYTEQTEYAFGRSLFRPMEAAIKLDSYLEDYPSQKR